MTLGKPSGKSGFGLKSQPTPAPAAKAGENGDGTGSDSGKSSNLPSIKPTLLGMPAARTPSPVPTVSPDDVADSVKSFSAGAMAAIDAPQSQNFTRADVLFSKLVDARPQLGRLMDFINDPVEFDDQFREFCADSAFLREVEFWLSNRIVRAQFVPNGPIEDGWLFIESLLTKPELSASHGLLSFQLKKITNNDPLTSVGTIKSVHLRRIIPHNMAFKY